MTSTSLPLSRMPTASSASARAFAGARTFVAFQEAPRTGRVRRGIDFLESSPAISLAVVLAILFFLGSGDG